MQGFWSFTIYNLDGFVTPNTGNTYYGDNVYSLGSMQMANVLGANLNTTPVTFYLQSTPPSDPALMPYWLPVPNEAFEIILRMYFPSSTNPSILNGTYTIPPVVRVSAPSVTTGVTVLGSKAKNRATFLIRNVGNTTTTFDLRQTRKLSGPGMGSESEGSHSRHEGDPLITLATTLGGSDIPSALEKNRASVTLAPGASAKAVTKINLRRSLSVRRKLRLSLQVTGQITPISTASRALNFTLHP